MKEKDAADHRVYVALAYLALRLLIEAQHILPALLALIVSGYSFYKVVIER